jgi:hypothetical protein
MDLHIWLQELLITWEMGPENFKLCLLMCLDTRFPSNRQFKDFSNKVTAHLLLNTL